MNLKPIWMIVFLLISKSSYGMKYLFLNIGEHHQISSPAGDTLMLSKKGVIYLQEKSDHILIQAKKEGLVTLRQNLQLTLVKVLKDKSGWVQFIKQIEQDPWLTWSLSEENQGSILIFGNLYRFSVWKKLIQLSKHYRIPFALHAQISESVQKEANSFFQSIWGNHNFQLKWIQPITVYLREKNPSIIESQYGVKIQVHSNLFLPPLIEIQFLLAQVHQNFSKNLSTQSLSDLSIENLIENHLHSSQQKGVGKIIASSKLIAESNQEVNYFIGGTTPIHQMHLESGTTQVRSKPYGLSLKFRPQVLNNQRIAIRFSIDISEIDHSQSSKGSPSTKNHRLESTITTTHQKTIRLSELIRSHAGNHQNGSFSFSHLLSQFLPSLSASKNYAKEQDRALLWIRPVLIFRPNQ